MARMDPSTAKSGVVSPVATSMALTVVPSSPVHAEAMRPPSGDQVAFQPGPRTRSSVPSGRTTVT